MTLEYIVLGILLIIMGVVQIWLRHGPGARELARDEERRLQEERVAFGRREDDEDEWSEDDDGPPLDRRKPPTVTPGGRLRSGRRWEAWTAILGGVGIVLGVVLVVMGATGA